MSESHSYGRILRSTSLMGLASVLNYVVGLVRVKLVALLLGPGGIGLVSLYTSTTALVSTVAALGLSNSAVRVLAQAHEANDSERFTETVKILRRACWVLGSAGWILTAALSPWLSDLVFASRTHVGALALLGGTVLFSILATGHTAILQGVQRIADVARLNIVTMLVNSVLTVYIYLVLGEEGIVPALLLTAATNVLVAWHFSSRVSVGDGVPSWSTVLQGVRALASLGVAFMWSAILLAALDVFVRGFVARELGMEAAGYYQAAWTLSGLFAGFILTSMSSDFYPRLSAHIHDHPTAVRIINHQTEIGILLAIPGLMATLAFSPVLIALFYSAEFQPGSALLPWFVLGILGRVIAWPLGFVQLALGASKLFVATETLFVTLQAFLVIALVQSHGLVGVALAFSATYAIYLLAMLMLARHLVGFGWSPASLKLIGWATISVLVGFSVRTQTSGVHSLILGTTLTILASIFSIRGVVSRIGTEHRLSKIVRSLTPWLLK